MLELMNFSTCEACPNVSSIELFISLPISYGSPPIIPTCHHNFSYIQNSFHDSLKSYNCIFDKNHFERGSFIFIGLFSYFSVLLSRKIMFGLLIKIHMHTCRCQKRHFIRKENMVENLNKLTLFVCTE